MTLGWGIFIPLGIVLAASLRWKAPMWFQLHRAIQLIGLILALAGFILALVEFNVSGTDTPIGKHRVIGIIIMAVGLFQPVNAFLRPHAPEAGASKGTIRAGWEVLHKGAGYIITIMAICNVFLGMNENRKLGQHSLWYIAVFGGYLGALLSLYIGLMAVGRPIMASKRMKQKEADLH